ncbi:MAG: hypothetical protein ACJ8FY_20935 [Gemmataceae bacterium]
MTTFGKVLIFLNLVLALAGAAWAMGLYTQRVNWTGKAGPDGTPGKVQALTDKIKDRLNGLAIAEARYGAEPSRLFGLENFRASAQATYRAQLAQLQDGDQNCKEVVVKDGAVVMDPNPQSNWLPLFQAAKDRNGNPMRSIKMQLGEISKTQDSIHQVMLDIDKAHKDNARITALLIGDKGLRERLASEHAKARKIEDAIIHRDVDKGIYDGDLRARTRDYEVERALLAERNKQLEERVKELEKTGVARQP